MALQIALQALRLQGDVVTTPFTFPATLHAIHFAGLTPVFCDIDPSTLQLDPSAAAAAVSPRTAAVLPVHLFGNACDVRAFESLGQQHGLRIVYDAAQGFGISISSVPITSFGDASAMSFDATKVFHTLEGGAVVVSDFDAATVARQLRSFGVDELGHVHEPGVNDKLNELSALIGLRLLDGFAAAVNHRQHFDRRYRENLANVPGVRPVPRQSGVSSNYAYFTVTIDDEQTGVSRDAVAAGLCAVSIDSRVYSPELATQYSHYKSLPSAAPGRLPVAERAVKQVLTLPLLGGLEWADVDRVCQRISDLIGA